MQSFVHGVWFGYHPEKKSIYLFYLLIFFFLPLLSTFLLLSPLSPWWDLVGSIALLTGVIKEEGGALDALVFSLSTNFSPIPFYLPPHSFSVLIFSSSPSPSSSYTSSEGEIFD